MRSRLPHGIGLGFGKALGLHQGHGFVRAEILNDSLGDQKNSGKQGQRQQNMEGGAGQVHPEIADHAAVAARQAADQGDRDSDAGGGGGKVVYRESGHLGEVTDRGLAAVYLPVGVGGETDGRVEGHGPWGVRYVLRVQRQKTLQAQHGKESDKHDTVEGQQGGRILPPVHLLIRNPAAAVDQFFRRGHERGKDGALPLIGSGHEQAQWSGEQSENRQVGEKFKNIQINHDGYSSITSTCRGCGQARLPCTLLIPPDPGTEWQSLYRIPHLDGLNNDKESVKNISRCSGRHRGKRKGREAYAPRPVIVHPLPGGAAIPDPPSPCRVFTSVREMRAI